MRDDKEYSELEHEMMANSQPEIDTGGSAVAVTPAKNALILIILAAIVGAVIYFVFFATEEVEKHEEKPVITESTPSLPAAPADFRVSTPSLPSLPEPPKLTPPVVPEPALPAPTLTTPSPSVPEPVAAKILPPSSATSGDKGQITAEQRRKSGILMGGGGGAGAGGQAGAGGPASAADKDKDKDKEKKPEPITNSYFSLQHTTAEQAKATHIGNTDYVIAEGKIIDAVLETAINTELQGALRAVVARDVYAETGKNILIPKGSRLIGSYSVADLKRGQNRVAIAWKRVIRPDGIDVMIDSTGVDALGRSGQEGLVDNHYMEIFGNAILLSIINISIANIADKLAGNGNSSTSTSTTDPSTGAKSVTSTSTASGQAIQESVKNLGDIGKDIIKDYISVKPTIMVDQGTKVKVFVKKDLVFPVNTAYGGAKVVQ